MRWVIVNGYKSYCERETMLSWYGHDVQLVMRWGIVHGYRLHCERETMPSWYGHNVRLVKRWVTVHGYVILQERDYELTLPQCQACDEVRDSSWLQVTLQERETMPSWYGHNVRLVMGWGIVHGYRLHCERETMPSWYGHNVRLVKRWVTVHGYVILQERDYELTLPQCPACDEVRDSSWLQVTLQERETMPSWYGHNVRLVMGWVTVHAYVILQERDYELTLPQCPACDEVSLLLSSWSKVMLLETICQVDMTSMSDLWWGKWCIHSTCM